MLLHLLCILFLVNQTGSGKAKPGTSVTETFDVNGTKRQAIVVKNSKPAPKDGSPLVFVFHGHGGTASNLKRRMAIQDHWPEAIIVYMQGIPGVAGVTDAEGKQNGWQKNPKEVDDRDIKFFDVALEQLTKKYKIDSTRIYAMGHSNGSRFTCVLWNQRGDKFAALCTSGGQAGAMLRTCKPISVFAIAGEKDPIVPFDGQKKSIDGMRKLLKADASKAKSKGLEKIEPGAEGRELVTYIHPGGHEYPNAAIPLIVQFFQRHPSKK